MKKYIKYVSFLIAPFLFMIIVNELVRPTIKEKPYTSNNIDAINSAEKISDKCTWVCHNSKTTYCKKNHVKYLNKYYRVSDRMYNGILNLLYSTGNYWLANIIFLVILIPLVIWILLIKSINIQNEINKLKKNNE